MKQTVCLCMIVKDEAKSIERCLRSVLPFVDRWVIVDTGSTDETIDIIFKVMRETGFDNKGNLHQNAWINFSTNRNQALRYVPDNVDYIFVIDADEELIIPKNYIRPILTESLYNITMKIGTYEYPRASVLRKEFEWEYRGILHEYLTAKTSCVPISQGHLFDLNVIVHFDERDTKQKYLKHAEILEEEIKKDPTNSRNMFYLAQSYKDAGEYQKAYDTYQKRIEMAGYKEEIWYSFFQLGTMAIHLKKEDEEIICWYLKAYNCIPERAGESLGQLVRYLNVRELHQLASLFSKIAAECIKPNSGLFIDTSWYIWRAKWFHSVTCSMIGRNEEAALYWQELQYNEYVTNGIKQKCIENIQKYESKRKLRSKLFDHIYSK